MLEKRREDLSMMMKKRRKTRREVEMSSIVTDVFQIHVRFTKSGVESF